MQVGSEGAGLNGRRAVWQDLSFSAILAGVIAVVVGFAGSAAIVFQAARAAGADDQEIGSWLWALGLGLALTSVGLSLRFREPVVTAWSTPGAALLVTAASGVPLAECIAAFVICGAMITLSGVTGGFERIMNRMPAGLAAAMLAGVLLHFGIRIFALLPAHAGLVLGMLATWLAGRRWWPRYALLAALAVGVGLAGFQGQLQGPLPALQLAHPHWVWPRFSLHALAIALPLFLVTMASQNMPGLAVLRSYGYRATRASPVMTWTGLATLLLAPLGAFAINLAAITAAICMGAEVHDDARRRYVAALASGLTYLLLGLFGATVAAGFAALPPVLVAVLAGMALLPTLTMSLATALIPEQGREPAMVTFLVTASGLDWFGLGAPLWGLLAGLVMTWALRRRADGRVPQARG
ncbi:benzoate/H(+) symporter BenE family transporter [Frateuria aurantia]|nr:benzoate/H(+) symporter BenE family transporter [Frateuria aurantia]